VPSKKLKVDLPLNKPTEVKLGKLAKGEIRFACGMGMSGGKIIVE
jgi:plastocyanin domain-containing protein